MTLIQSSTGASGSGGGGDSVKKITGFTVTTAFLAGEVLNITTGNGGVSGITNREILSNDGAVSSLGATSGDFKSSGEIVVTLNGVTQKKVDNVVWDSTTSFHFIDPLAVGEYIEIWQTTVPPTNSESLKRPIKTVSSAYLATTSDWTILGDTTGGDFIVTLPTANGAYNSNDLEGNTLNVVSTSSVNTLTLQADGAEEIGNINPTNNLIIPSGDSVKVQSNGTSWNII